MRNYVLYIVVYFASISIVTCAITALDKYRAGKGRWRIPEATLFLLAAFGGSVAEYITMKIIRHKTKHARFMVGLPCIFVLQIAAIVVLHIKVF